MYVRASPDTIELVEADDFGRFHVTTEIPDDATLGAALAAARAGYVRAGVGFVSVPWLRRCGDNSTEWLDGLEGMLGYAASKGWVHDDHVQAHVERPA